jgi:hypothetical protein
MTKQELLNQLTNAKNNYILGLAGISLFAAPEAYPILEKSHAAFGTYTVQFAQLADLLRNPKDREIAVKEFLVSQIRALIKESFELVKDYCLSSGQETLFYAEPWYQFARMIRNCLSHSYRFEFNRYDQKLLPISWRGNTITSAMNGQNLTLDFFGYVETWELFQEFHGFARTWPAAGSEVINDPSSSYSVQRTAHKTRRR